MRLVSVAFIYKTSNYVTHNTYVWHNCPLNTYAKHNTYV